MGTLSHCHMGCGLYASEAQVCVEGYSRLPLLTVWPLQVVTEGFQNNVWYSSASAVPVIPNSLPHGQKFHITRPLNSISTAMYGFMLSSVCFKATSFHLSGDI